MYSLKLIIKHILSFFLHVFWLFPIKKNRITLLNELSFKYGDNLKYLHLYMEKNYKNTFNIVFPMTKKELINGLIIPKPFSLQYFYYLLTSKFIITNAGGISYLPLRKNQIVINTWHGGGPYKKTGIDMSSNKYQYKQTALNAKKITYMLSTAKNFDDFESKSLLLKPSQLVPTGYPRIDIFFHDNKHLYKKVKDYYKIDYNKKIILYAPTFRDTNIDTAPDRKLPELNIDYKNVCSTLQQKFGGDWIFAYRLHPKLSNVFENPAGTFNFSDYPDMQELLYISDVVITDYSSLMWDYSFTKRPCFLYAFDIEEYEKTRGFYMPAKDWPYPLAHNNDELINNIKSFSIEKYINDVNKHHEICGIYEKGEACRMTLELINKYM